MKTINTKKMVAKLQVVGTCTQNQKNKTKQNIIDLYAPSIYIFIFQNIY